MIKIEVKNLVLKYPIKNLNNYLFRAKVINKIKKFFIKIKILKPIKKKKT